LNTASKALITWDIPEYYLNKLKENFATIEFVKKFNANEINREIENADILFAGRVSEANINKAKSLKWIQLHGHGIEKYLFPKVLDSEIILTNANQVHHIPMAEHAFALMLNYTRKITHLHEAQKKSYWAKQDYYTEMMELYDKNLLLIGTGNIGSEIAKRAQAFGMNVSGLRRNSNLKHQYFEKIYSMEELHTIIPSMDFIISTLPLTSETKHTINKTQLMLMKKDALLINLGRGGVIKEEDLIVHLKKHKRFHCALDVFDIEPLTSDSALYQLQNVFVSPHISGISPQIAERQYIIFKNNLERYIQDKPLFNVVEKSLGY